MARSWPSGRWELPSLVVGGWLDGQPCAEHGPGAAPTFYVQRSVDRCDAIPKPLQSRAGAHVCAADAVVADFDVEVIVALVDAHPGAGCACVLRDVGERLAHGEVGGGFDGDREPRRLEHDVQGDRDAGSMHEAGQRMLEPAIAQDRGMQSVCEVTELAESGAQVGEGIVELHPCVVGELTVGGETELEL